MKTNWQTKNLGEICKISTGKSNANEAVENGDYAFFDRSKTIKRSTRFLFDCEALIIPGEGAEFFPRYYSGKFDLHQRAYALFDFDSKVDIRFVEYYLIFDHKYFERVAVGATAKSLRLRHFQDLQIPLPSIQEQQRIVKILDGVFENIEKTKENAEKNLQNSKALFESYLQNIFANTGDNWEKKRLGDVCELTRGQNPPKSKFINEPREGYVRFYQIRDGWSDNYPVYVPDNPQLHKIKPDDILMVAYRHIGKAFRGVAGAFNVALCKISNKRRDILCDDFLFYMIPTDIIKGELMKRSERSLIPSMSIEHLKEIIISLPPLAEQKSIVVKLNTLSAETKKLEEIYRQKLAGLEELKKSVLQKAFLGEL